MNKPGIAGLTYYSATFIDNGRDDDLVDKIPDGYSYEGTHGGYPYGSFYKDRIEYAIGMGAAGTDPLASIEFPLNFTVTAASSATVDVKVDGVDSITKSTGSSVAVTWTSYKVDSPSTCSCQCQDNNGNTINCGNTGSDSCGEGFYKEIPTIFYEILTPTVFKVECK